MHTVWAQRREEVLRDCLVSPDVFTQMVDRLGEFVVPYQQTLETEAGQYPMHLYLQGLLSHVPRKNAEQIAALVDVERQVIQDFIGTAPWDHRPLIQVLVGQVAERLGEPDGGNFCPSRHKGKMSEVHVLALFKECTKSTFCTASSATPQAGDDSLQTVQNCARTAAKINVQQVLPLDKFLHIQVAL